MTTENLHNGQDADSEAKSSSDLENKSLTAATISFPSLMSALPRGDAIDLIVVEGIPVFRASDRVQRRVDELLEKLKASGLSDAEEKELDQYEELDDFLSLQNRLTRNYYLNPLDSLSAA